MKIRNSKSFAVETIFAFVGEPFLELITEIADGKWL